MKTQPNEGIHPIVVEGQWSGLTKREYFAAMAMQGLLSCNALYNGKENKQMLSRDAAIDADALITELNKTV